MANEGNEKDNLFDSQASPHSVETKATTAAMTKTMRETGTMRDPGIESPRLHDDTFAKNQTMREV